jgi:hypothetical protein
MVSTKYVSTYAGTAVRHPVPIMDKGGYTPVECDGCAEIFTAKRNNLPKDMIGYCANTGRREQMKTR